MILCSLMRHELNYLVLMGLIHTGDTPTSPPLTHDSPRKLSVMVEGGFLFGAVSCGRGLAAYTVSRAP